MSTLNQLIKRKFKKTSNKKIKKLGLQGNPQRRGVCLKIFKTTPKKPNSAQRPVVKIRLSNQTVTIAHIPGEGHTLQEYSNVLLRGGRTQDLPGVKHKIVRGVLDLKGVENRKTARSKYGVKKNKSK